MEQAATGFGGLANTACMRGDGSFSSHGLVMCNWLAATYRLAMCPIVGCV